MRGKYTNKKAAAEEEMFREELNKVQTGQDIMDRLAEIYDGIRNGTLSTEQADVLNRVMGKVLVAIEVEAQNVAVGSVVKVRIVQAAGGASEVVLVELDENNFTSTTGRLKLSLSNWTRCCTLPPSLTLIQPETGKRSLAWCCRV